MGALDTTARVIRNQRPQERLVPVPLAPIVNAEACAEMPIAQPETMLLRLSRHVLDPQDAGRRIVPGDGYYAPQTESFSYRSDEVGHIVALPLSCIAS